MVHSGFIFCDSVLEGGVGRGCYLLLGDVAFLGFDFLVFVFYYEVIKVLVARWERTHKG